MNTDSLTFKSGCLNKTARFISTLEFRASFLAADKAVACIRVNPCLSVVKIIIRDNQLMQKKGKLRVTDE
jgi:hypothetical protein